VSSASGAAFGAVHRNLISPSPVALPAPFFKKSAALQEFGRGFHYSNFLGDRCRNPLVQRHAIFFRQPLSSLLDGERKLQWISRFAHDLSLTFFNSSAGRNTGIPNRSAPNSTVDAQPLKGRLILELSASLKRCPDTKPHFFLTSLLPPLNSSSPKFFRRRTRG